MIPQTETDIMESMTVNLYLYKTRETKATDLNRLGNFHMLRIVLNWVS